MRRRGNKSEETTAAAVTGWALTALDEFERGPDAREGRAEVDWERAARPPRTGRAASRKQR
jgi:hypothetical protein